MITILRAKIPTGFGVAGLLYTLIGLVGSFVAVNRLGSPRGASEWATAGTWVYDYLTFGLLIAAVYGGFKVAEQLRAERDRHHDQIKELRNVREASSRPVMAIVGMRVFSIPGPGGQAYGSLIVALKNVGPGPVMGFTVRCWVKPTAGAPPIGHPFWDNLKADPASGWSEYGGPVAPGTTIEIFAPTGPEASEPPGFGDADHVVWIHVNYIGINLGPYSVPGPESPPGSGAFPASSYIPRVQGGWPEAGP